MSHCPRCGAEFSCGMKEGDRQHCWCLQIPALATEILQEVKAEWGADRCLCPACLQAATPTALPAQS